MTPPDDHQVMTNATWVPPQYPELTALARELADNLCCEINRRAPAIESEMRYREKYVLEELISILEDRV